MCDSSCDQSSSNCSDHSNVVRVNINSNVQYINENDDFYNDVTINSWGIIMVKDYSNLQPDSSSKSLVKDKSHCKRSYWVANNGSNKICKYFFDGELLETVKMTGSEPTGLVNNYTNYFEQYNIIAVSRKGTIEGFKINELGDADYCTTIIYPNKNAVYTGVDLTRKKLYVCNFESGRVEIFDRNFNPVGSFTDQSLVSSGYHPHNILIRGKRVYVAFAKKDENNCPVNGIGFGYVVIFNRKGELLYRRFNREPLNAPWGLALSKCGECLYVGNHGDGRINVFDTRLFEYIGPLKNKNCGPVQIGNLWGIFDSNDRLSFASGMDSKSCSEPCNGLIGYLQYC